MTVIILNEFRFVGMLWIMDANVVFNGDGGLRGGGVIFKNALGSYYEPLRAKQAFGYLNHQLCVA